MIYKQTTNILSLYLFIMYLCCYWRKSSVPTQILFHFLETVDPMTDYYVGAETFGTFGTGPGWAVAVHLLLHQTGRGRGIKYATYFFPVNTCYFSKCVILASTKTPVGVNFTVYG